MEDDLKENNLNGRWHEWKTTSTEDDLNGKLTQQKTTSTEDDLNGRRPQQPHLTVADYAKKGGTSSQDLCPQPPKQKPRLKKQVWIVT